MGSQIGFKAGVWGHEAGWHLADVTLAASGLSGTEARVPLAGAGTPECRGMADGWL